MGSGAGNSDFVSEFQFGVQWLEKMWNDSTKTLYYQVGIGEGNTQTVGDHDIWRLPQADDTYGGTNPLYRYIRNRPVFEAGPPGSPISPNLAGRLAADFGLCAQVFVSSDPSLAASCLEDGEDVYALADTDPTGRLLTTAPYVFYPETQWRDDMELGATELAAAVGPGPQQNAYMTDAAQWAAACMASADQDTLNLYDVGGLAHYELARLITGTGATGLAVTPTMLVDQLRSQIEGAVAVGRKFPFAFGYPWSASDTVSHGAGLSVMASEYDALTGTTTFAAEAQGWLDNILGANPWGVSFIIGDGSTFPLCPQHQVANLVGSTNGTTPILAGRPSKDPPMRRPEAWSAVWSPVPSAAGTPMPRSTGTGLSTWTTCSRTPPTNRPSISPPPHPWPWPGWLQPGRRARPHDDRSGFGKRSVVMVEAKGIARVGVVGCGLMGSGIVEVCARAGLDVRVVEVDVGALEAGQKRVETSLQRAAAAGKMAPDEATSALDRIDFTTDFESLADRQLIVEAVVESEAEKLDVFERLDHVLEDDSAVLASNTSSIPIMKLAMATRRPAQVIGIHFFNPVPVLPLVEVVTSLMTSEETADLAEEFARTVLGKHVIRSKDRAGFIVNALLVPYLLSAIRMFESGFATAEDIDAGMTKGCAHPMGPLALSDLIGLDTTMAVANSLYEEFKEPLYAPPPLLARMVEAGLFGRKSGRGFYDYQKH
jgi:3-hydroxybutyryl-CoA dehydrogenase